MRRVLLAGMVLVVVLVVVRSRDEGPALRVGPWHGETSQGYPVSFVVSDDDGDLTVDEWRMRLDLRCEATGRRVALELFLSMPTPITDRRFAERHSSLIMWFSGAGGFLTDDGARGRLGAVMPVLSGEELEELRSEKCAATDLAWTAHPGHGDDEEVAGAPADVKLRIERDGRVLRM